MKENEEKEWIKIIQPPELSYPIMEYYENSFEAIYLILNPFMLIPKHIDVYDGKHDIIRKKYVLDNAKKISWEEVVKNKRALDYILHKYLQGRIDERRFSDFEGVHYDNEEIFGYLESQNIYTPLEGGFSELLENDFLRSLLDFAYEEVYVCNEFLSKSKLINVREQINDNYIIMGEILCTPDEKIVYGAYWDGYFTLLLSEKKIIEKIVKKYNFEGFYCTKDTTIRWFEDKNLI